MPVVEAFALILILELFFKPDPLNALSEQEEIIAQNILLGSKAFQNYKSSGVDVFTLTVWGCFQVGF